MESFQCTLLLACSIKFKRATSTKCRQKAALLNVTYCDVWFGAGRANPRSLSTAGTFVELRTHRAVVRCAALIALSKVG
eukprot:4479817-Amphidinium_carterae.1